ncbi:37S ribosomal protein S24, mitochondrial [Collariella sp. IMI 366227]|nr:37S ribosomal protein S24, mitochondrial [Collariella sp. IMI 366227]
MASPANLLRLCLRTSRQRLPIARAAAVQQPLLHPSSSSRPFSTTTPWRAAAAPENEAPEGEEPELEQEFSNPGEVLQQMAYDETLTVAQRARARQLLEDYRKVPAADLAQLSSAQRQITAEMAPLRRPVRIKKDSFWNEEESDADLITDEIGEDDFEEDDIMAMGHAKLEEHREFREYARIAVWEMPLLSKLAKPFKAPAEDEVLRFRYTTYMGEFHPADRKVVVEFSPGDMPGLTDVQKLKMKKLAGSRYNPEKDIIKMSCERFEHQAQNKRYLGDIIDKMVETAKDPTDTFEDVPLDTRHHKFKQVIKFPKEWYMTEERKKELVAQRQAALLLDEGKRAEGLLIDGKSTIQEAMSKIKVEQLVPVVRGGGGKTRRR